MSDRKDILQMLADGKINVEEAERLMAAVDTPAATGAGGSGAKPKYLHVMIDAEKGHGGPAKVNVRVPMQLLRAGMRLSSMIPPHARERANAAMRAKGVDFDLNDLKPENLEELITQLNDLTVDIDQEDEYRKAKVRIFCE